MSNIARLEVTPRDAVNPYLHQCYWCERETAWHRTIQHGDDVYYCFDHFERGAVAMKEGSCYSKK